MLPATAIRRAMWRNRTNLLTVVTKWSVNFPVKVAFS